MNAEHEIRYRARVDHALRERSVVLSDVSECPRCTFLDGGVELFTAEYEGFEGSGVLWCL